MPHRNQFAIAFRREQLARQSLATDPGGRALLFFLMIPLAAIILIAAEVAWRCL